MNIAKHLPNTMTCTHLLCGCFGILNVFEGNLVLASVLLVIGGVLDFFDGFVARLLHVSSPMGKELDSIADMVTFGALPAFMMLNLLESSCSGLCSTGLFGFHKPYIAFMLAVFSALRLAKFNVDTRQTSSFIGVPTPANALVIASLPLIELYQPEYKEYIMNFNVLLVYTVVMSYLMVSELPLFALKFKTFGWKDNQIKYIFLITSVLLLILLKFVAIPLIIFLYIVFSVFGNLTKKKITDN
ncbi:CDP-diacylglycerol---serine O-phosphatidyltransferase [Pseudarcicella hirudinis]|uniref:CDP-diacylglycerol--serine O-phosphatidyltransferase n=2 Tax=Pseudarcicella hirudinis TaxID=1079859 RepID=A0A1I5PHD2_9BACT|nr:CDP-diacylglycerol--serine O-phosphatidyltransferase [Pseudarcicella hirudinis]SFP32951.1 CDP-diacylglycerol---serine O-phosphatidyltransferase [Pseudarcicella hirudinis]